LQDHGEVADLADDYRCIGRGRSKTGFAGYDVVAAGGQVIDPEFAAIIGGCSAREARALRLDNDAGAGDAGAAGIRHGAT
jgi:hypothetical protein